MRVLLLLVAMFFILGQPIFASGFDAGYEWAAQHDITDPEYSNGNSEEFNEGVRAYANEQIGNLQDARAEAESRDGWI